MEILKKIEIEVRVKCRLTRQFAFPVPVIPSFVPHWIRSIKVISYVIRYIRNNQLRWRDCIFFVILHIVSVYLTFYFFCVFHFSRKSRDIPLRWPPLRSPFSNLNITYHPKITALEYCHLPSTIEIHHIQFSTCWVFLLCELPPASCQML